MHYELIVNLPLQSTADVLAEAFRFVKMHDPQLLRLDEAWVLIPGGVSLHDSFNNQNIPIGRNATPEEFDPDDFHCFSDGYANYKLLEDLPQSNLDDILEVFNDLYGADAFAVRKTSIGYGFYKCV